jgi:hypothetical protein
MACNFYYSMRKRRREREIAERWNMRCYSQAKYKQLPAYYQALTMEFTLALESV